jgi:hypothetical protein
VTVTLAFAMADPDGSVTVPVIVPRSRCPKAALLHSKKTRNIDEIPVSQRGILFPPQLKLNLGTTGLDFITRKRLHQEVFNTLELLRIVLTSY